MHTGYKPCSIPVDSYNFEEYCPLCDSYIPVRIDNDDHKNYEIVCPVCGQRLMLCTLCHWDGHDCDWCECENGECHMMKGGNKNA